MSSRSGERAQSLVEVVAVAPLCALCALALVDAGLIVRDRVATSQAAGRAAVAELRGGDSEEAARDALPDGLERDMEIRVEDGEVVVTTTSRPNLLRVPGGVEHRSNAHTSDEKDGDAV